MRLARIRLDGKRPALAVYNALQIALIGRFVARCGTAQQWCALYAPAFRRRYGWLLETGRLTARGSPA